MVGRFLGRRLIRDRDVLRIGADLADRLTAHRPEVVVYLETGGALLGKVIAAQLSVPAYGLDIRYPFSRWVPSPLDVVAFPFKEIIYRMTRPIATGTHPTHFSERIALVDDTAGSGRSLRLAKAILVRNGASVSSIKTAVIRCGRRARSEVDHFAFEEPVLLLRK